MSATSMTSGSTQTRCASEPVAATAALSRLSIVAWPGLLTALNVPLIRSSAACRSHPARSWREHIPAALDPAQPPRHPPDQFVGAEDQAGPGEHRRAFESLKDCQLAAALGRRVVVRLFASRIAFDDRRALVCAWRHRPGVDRTA